ncbi:MAG: hypothetical protein IJS89_02415 [Bacteroidaceae bacterium]|nr:hypothetical protein [Bacteroidaceae bacterium]
MKKFLLYSLALLLTFTLSAGRATAQELDLPVQIPELNPKVLEKAQPAIGQMLMNPDKATKAIDQAIKATKNDKGQLMALAYWLMQQEDGIQGARYVIEKAYALNAKDIDVMLLAGDIYGTMGQWGRAGQKYDQVLEVDSTNLYALVQGARIYKNHNADASLSLWEKILALQPAPRQEIQMLAYRNIGDILYDKNYTGEALENYGKYFDGTPHTKQAINAPSMEKYLIGLFFTEGKEARLAEVGVALHEADPTNIVYNRFAFIGSMLTYDSVPATLERIKGYAKYVTDGTTPDSSLIYQDYFYAYQMCEAGGDYANAVRFLGKAVDKDPTQVDFLKHGAFRIYDAGQPSIAAELYDAYCDRKGEEITDEDRLQVLVFYRQGITACQDSIAQLDMRDKAFGVIDRYLSQNTVSAANKYQVLLEKARILNVMKGRNGDQVATAYEEALKACPNEEAAGMNVYDAYYVLMNHHASKVADVQTDEEFHQVLSVVRTYCSKALALDPTNEAVLEMDDLLYQNGH